MTALNQQILRFDYEQNFKDQDFYVSNSNEHSFALLNTLFVYFGMDLLNLNPLTFEVRCLIFFLFHLKFSYIYKYNIKLSLLSLDRIVIE